jgi:hypothetical protein
MSRIAQIRVEFMTGTHGRPQSVTIDLGAMLRHCRRERVEDVVEDLTLLCEDVLAGRRRQPPGTTPVTGHRLCQERTPWS